MYFSTVYCYDGKDALFFSVGEIEKERRCLCLKFKLPPLPLNNKYQNLEQFIYFPFTLTLRKGQKESSLYETPLLPADTLTFVLLSPNNCANLKHYDILQVGLGMGG